MSESGQGIWDVTLRRVRRAWPLGGRGALKDRVAPDLPENDAQALRRQIDACLDAQGGEVSARARAAELGETYLILSEVGRLRFLRILADEYGADEAAVAAAIERWQRSSGNPEHAIAAVALRDALTPPRIRLLSQFNTLDEGVKFLVDLRAELRAMSREDTQLAALDGDLLRLLSSWFDVGFLELRRITWHSPAALLEKLTAYEAVHEIRSWKDLKNRLGDDRRCYAYFHPNMPEEPLIFVEIALVNGIASNVQELLDPGAPILDAERTDTAIFYSISNCQAGLAGVSFGNFLIKRVVSDLARELPNLKTFCTLSPIPGFRRWLRRELDEDRVPIDARDVAQLERASGKDSAGEALDEIMEQRASYGDDELSPLLRRVLTQQCARFLLTPGKDGRARDRVAHFHLSNGASIERINFNGDVSAKGLAQSAGLMVNYLYKLAEIERNHESYTDSGEISASSTVRRLARP
jgi:malonyl-CoA decarboxylase